MPCSIVHAVKIDNWSDRYDAVRVYHLMAHVVVSFNMVEVACVCNPRHVVQLL